MASTQGESEFIVFENDSGLMTDVLSVYFDHARYLEQAEVTLDTGHSAAAAMTAKGRFAIPSSCYIESTGHFNSVEFNICFNQLFYYMTAMAVKHQLLPEFAGWDLDLFFKKQLPDILIVKLSSRFKRPISASKFTGELSFNGLRLVSGRRGVLYLKTASDFYDDQNGACSGAVDLAIVDMPSEDRV